ncbi:hypothetical protein PGTDC60_1771 [Porphyromonas gingivalis TDC60]|uniref:Uncharacterized protein n=2 Tax=Porphyromonas gingivalis TaxID=837 RepID=B2RIK6_PORG3|nr:hypothetical protein A343_1019 [Porphyromonas gingivalis JCVI SC001]ERJ63986.1 hypothetical protein HMPREF1555_02118 [Porphyromonas gingivalis F0570]ERJ66424.1 hypothetical protein HMPREF1554_01358 [Porphyromonas gingivalis F0569]ERJ67072.1 hypothetical protein HMPREF1553_01536 [Porphyromonas gingivalis F0568]ERJ81771.1 hypothetical protein HMPREF1988_01829 [Porphyromonas gingivalis F0185]ERJ86438.1 hypothetical protein HMPREF1989_01290 [Porphyromonas gingivalis F0566]BAG33201.1 hypothetic
MSRGVRKDVQIRKRIPALDMRGISALLCEDYAGRPAPFISALGKEN